MPDMVHITRKEIAKSVKVYRIKNGMSQKDLGSVVERSGAWIGKLERFPKGYRPCGDSFIKLLVHIGYKPGLARGIAAAVYAPPYSPDNKNVMDRFDTVIDETLGKACRQAGLDGRMTGLLSSEMNIIPVICDD